MFLFRVLSTRLKESSPLSVLLLKYQTISNVGGVIGMLLLGFVPAYFFLLKMQSGWFQLLAAPLLLYGFISTFGLTTGLVVSVFMSFHKGY
jgi:hypothetical protein